MKLAVLTCFLSCSLLYAVFVGCLQRIDAQNSTNAPPPLPIYSGPGVAHTSEFADVVTDHVPATVLVRTQTNWMGGPTRFWREYHVEMLGTMQPIKMYVQQGVVNTSHVVRVAFNGKTNTLTVGDWGRVGETERVFRMEGTTMLVLTNMASQHRYGEPTMPPVEHNR